MNRAFLLDTNIPSELMRPRPEPKVQGWVAAQDVGTLFMSVVSIGELETGFATTRDAVTQAIAVRWGRLDGMRQIAGRPLSAPDGMIAATALEHGLTLVTRNVKDFASLGVDLLNPWLDP